MDGKLDELSANLLYEISESLGYHFDKVTLKKDAYAPRAWGDEYQEQGQLRRAAIKVFEGTEKLKVEAHAPDPPVDPFTPPRS